METDNQPSPKVTLHHVLAHSYSVYFILFLIGVTLDFLFPIKIFTNSVMVPIGFSFLVVASLLIIWAQKTGRDLKKVQDVKAEHFCRGPYCYTRIPTQWGLFLLLLGFGIITSSFFVILSTVISLFIFKFIFISRHDQILTDKYGSAYAEYKKKVKF
ncbi:MAG: methyltransferase [Patescibacteria group bacterium]